MNWTTHVDSITHAVGSYQMEGQMRGNNLPGRPTPLWSRHQEPALHYTLTNLEPIFIFILISSKNSSKSLSVSILFIITFQIYKIYKFEK